MKRTSIVAIGALFLGAAGCPLALNDFTIGTPGVDGGDPDVTAGDASADGKVGTDAADGSIGIDTGLDTGVDGSVDTGIDTSPTCDLTVDPKDSLACVDDSVGVFVDSAASDANNGNKATPVATITHGLDVAKMRGVGRVYVCEGNYPEDVLITAANDGISIYGGFKCTAWSYSGIKPVIGKTQDPFKMDGLVKPVTIEDVEVDGKDGDVNTLSSIAMFVNASTNIKLKRVKLVAGKGFLGANGLKGINYKTIPQSDPAIMGNNAKNNIGGASHACMLCVDAKNSTGGGGGNAGGGSGKPGTDGLPNLGGAFPNDGKGGLGDTGNGCGGGDNGSAGGAGSSAASPVVLGTFDPTGWNGTPGLAGTNGGPAQGGGGGGGDQTGANNGGGGGGGCGGCGGAGGSGGTAGGASIGLGVLSSTVDVITSEIGAKDGGAGGSGAAGQGGELGGLTGTQNGAGCPGGTGGTGGVGGAAAGGAGGLSVGVLWKGAGAPTMDGATQGKITFGAKGAKGVGGNPGTNDGPDGVAQAVLQTM